MRTVSSTCTYRVHTCVDAVRRLHSGHFQGGGRAAERGPHALLLSIECSLSDPTNEVVEMTVNGKAG